MVSYLQQIYSSNRSVHISLKNEMTKTMFKSEHRFIALHLFEPLKYFRKHLCVHFMTTITSIELTSMNVNSKKFTSAKLFSQCPNVCTDWMCLRSHFKKFEFFVGLEELELSICPLSRFSYLTVQFRTFYMFFNMIRLNSSCSLSSSTNLEYFWLWFRLSIHVSSM